MSDAFICDAVRTPIGRYAGSLAAVRTDDLGAIPIKALMERNPSVDWSKVDDMSFGCANQAGEDNRNVGRMAALLAGLPDSAPSNTVNRLCGSGMDALGSLARAIKTGEADLCVGGGVVTADPLRDPGAARFHRRCDPRVRGWRRARDGRSTRGRIRTRAQGRGRDPSGRGPDSWSVRRIPNHGTPA